MSTTRSDNPRFDEVETPDEPVLVSPDPVSTARDTPAGLDLTGVDPVIAARLARIAEQARIDDASGITVLRSELDRVTEKLDHRSGDWEFEDAVVPAATTSAPLHDEQSAPPHDERWTHSNVALVTLGAAAALSLALALFPASVDRSTRAPATKVAAAVPSASHVAAAATSPLPGGESQAETARDAARAARFQSAKADAITYHPELHLAAQRKEVEADSALRSGNHQLAIVLYELARDGYRIAMTRSDTAAAQIEKARVDEQVAMDAQFADVRAAAARVAERQFVETGGSTAGRYDPAQAPIRPLILVPPSSGSPSDTPGSVVHTSLPQAPAREPIPRHANAYAAVYTEPTNGARSGGTWGACWRSSLDSARACAKANCEAGSASHRRCVEVASSRPGEHCVVARAHGFGVSTGACSPGRRDAEMAALNQCREQLAANYGTTSRGCSIAWSSDR